MQWKASNHAMQGYFVMLPFLNPAFMSGVTSAYAPM